MRSLATCLLLLAPIAARAALPPAAAAPAQFELGIGALAMVLPDYRGSDYYGPRVLPIPYVSYRSERLQLTREGLRARLFSSENVTASFSGAGSLPGADDNPDRAGMPRLDPTFELGPSLDVMLVDGEGDAPRLKLRVPVRAVIAADGFDLKHIGWTTVPHLRVDVGQTFETYHVSHLFSAGLAWSTEDYHEYFYGVAPEFTDPAIGRLAYDAGGGYSGLRASASSTIRFGKLRVGGFASYDYLGGAAFADSSLVKTDHALTAGVFVTYRLYESGGHAAPLEGEAE
ncbi:MAG TPA: MipA/OmpV family protein [Verrucomicrobiae bacterium]|nr:MipA/OmpV family protein [Verrucomicrobiae bacterium]